LTLFFSFTNNITTAKCNEFNIILIYLTTITMSPNKYNIKFINTNENRKEKKNSKLIFLNRQTKCTNEYE